MICFLAIGLWEVVAVIAARALIVTEDLPHADALVVLSGSATYVERSRGAATFLQSGRANRIIVTNDGQRGRWSNEQGQNPLFVERTVDELKRLGVPNHSIEVLPQVVHSTHDEAVLLNEYSAKHSLRTLLIVTSPYHSRRALWTFRNEFDKSGTKVGLMLPTKTPQTPSAWFWWLTPRGWRMVAGEYVKSLYYKIKFG